MNKIVKESLSIRDNITLYHRLMNKSYSLLPQFIKNVLINGLVPFDNGEVGSVIWFSDEYDDYAKTSKFAVSIKLNEYTIHSYDIHYHDHIAHAYNPIPFDELTVIKIPVYANRSIVTSSDEMIRLVMKDKLITPENMNNHLGNPILYVDIFEQYVQPYINIPNFISKLDTTKFTLINIL